ncbi:winged helix-turn-helix transcriptional regulator [Pimelobacter simplex]|uniref:Helix-turn-helix transcriptional regulator n=1 Tax=Nocardioides simplex TaxID=2045 RepID=A0A7J5E500_NOCSI|nr:helix-turn-helix domain-containing protein [Pimelobacter simplex]KAB2813147.1 helix-turn-helix transcriptional regulator [Pimelobacter simplex]
MPAADPTADHSVPPHRPGSNSLSRGFGLLGDEWSLFLLRLALLGRSKYSEFRAQLPISHAVLTNRLDTLVREGLIEKRMYSERPPRSEYVLTERGRSTWPILTSIWGWELAWVSHHSYETPPMHHRACGKDFAPVLTCGHCRQPVTARDLRAAWGPTGGWRESVPETTTRRRSGSRGTAVDHSFYPDTMAVFGNRWSSALVGAAFLRVHRFTDFQTLLGVPPGLLADRLSALCERGILEQVRTAARPDWAEYRLTEKGLAVFPVIATTIEWSERWVGSPEGPAIEIKHPACGSAFHGVLVCDQCGETLTGAQIELGSVPSAAGTPES